MRVHAAAASDEISRSYVRRAPEHGVLHRVVRELQALADETGFSRYAVDSAIKAGVIGDERIWRSPTPSGSS